MVMNELTVDLGHCRVAAKRTFRIRRWTDQREVFGG